MTHRQHLERVHELLGKKAQCTVHESETQTLVLCTLAIVEALGSLEKTIRVTAYEARERADDTGKHRAR